MPTYTTPASCFVVRLKGRPRLNESALFSCQPVWQAARFMGSPCMGRNAFGDLPEPFFHRGCFRVCAELFPSTALQNALGLGLLFLAALSAGIGGYDERCGITRFFVGQSSAK